MSYGLKYFARYRTNDGRVKELRFSKVDYTGAVTEWFVTHASVETDQGSSDNLFDNPIVTSQKKLGLFFLEKYDLTEFVFDRKTFFCEVVLVSTGKIEWSGWVEPWDAAHDYQKPPYAVSLTASCGLAHLSKKKYVNKDLIFKKNGLTLIKECLALIGSELGLRVSTHMKENSFTGDAVRGLESFEINVARYYNENGEALYCDEIIRDIINHFDAELTQWDNRWVVRGIVDHATGFERTYMEYPFNGGPVVPSSSWPGIYIINDTKAFTKDGGQERVLAPINKYRTDVDLGVQLPFFNNGNMAYWTESGLLGWNFEHMPKGNPGWERYFLGGEGVTSSVLKINGKAPQPYRKRKHKKLKKILVGIATAGVVSLDSRWRDIEPSEWIETSAGVFAPGDKSLTISFDYETAPNSSDVLISIRRKSSWKTDAPDNWVLFGLPGYSSVTEQFHLIRIPPAEREGLIYRGDLNVAGNPNYPNGSTVGWAYTIVGVPAGEIRRIGGPAGVIVENGDIIISKVSNPGGTQAAVGNSWNIIHVRNNPKKGTYSATIDVDAVNLLKKGEVNNPIIYDQVIIRFYKIADEKPGDWYKIYNLKGALEGFVPSAASGRYATTLERGTPTDEESETINLITGDYNPYFSGSWTKPGWDENTSSWSRRSDLTESLSIYRAMMLDRLCLTSRPLTVIEGDIHIIGDSADISYLHTLVLSDKSDMRMKIVRYSYNDIQRIVKITAVEIKYEEIPVGELRQDSYVPGEGTLNVIAGQGDGYYPTKSDSTNGRLSAENLPPSDEDLVEAVLESGRMGALFEDIPNLVYVLAEQSTQIVNLIDYLSEAFIESNEDQEPEDMFDPETLVLAVIDKPDWISLITFDKLEVSALGKPVKIADYYITLSATDPESETTIDFRIPVQVIDKTKVTSNLVDKTGGTNTVVGPIPGSYYVTDLSDLRQRVKGIHNEVRFNLVGGGLAGNAINLNRTRNINYQVNDDTYDMFADEGGYALPVGSYKLTTDSLFENDPRSHTVIEFLIYDEAYLALLKTYLTLAAAEVGEISPDGTTVFLNQKTGNIKDVIDGIDHDKITQELNKDGVVIKTTIHDVPIEASVGEYYLFDEDTELDPGVYNYTFMSLLATETTFKRESVFEIAEAEPKPEPGLGFGSFKPGTINFTLIDRPPLKGKEYDLPSNYSVLFDGLGGIPYWSAEWEFFFLRGGAFAPVNIEQYTGYPQNINYGELVVNEKLLLFGLKNSTQIGDVHQAPSMVRAVVTARDEAGKTVGIRQADFSLRIPLLPEDYSGLRFITINQDSFGVTVVDENMPKVDRKYLLPTAPEIWSVSARRFNGLLFDEVTLELSKNGVWLHSNAVPNAVTIYTADGPIIEVESDLLAYIVGTIGVGGRTLKDPAGVPVLIDDYGDYVVRATFTLAGAEIGVLESAYSLIEEPVEPPIIDCCGCEGGETEWNAIEW